MGIYKTYKEAVLANGSANGVFKDRGSFYTNNEKVSRFTLYCNPADYLETLESFLASGKRLVCGDLIVSINGLVISVKQYSRDILNTHKASDKERFILQAAADQMETPEGKEAFAAIDTKPQQVSGSENPNKSEWKNGDSVVFGKDARSGVYIAYDAYNEGHVVYSGGDYFYVMSGDFSKPEETPAEREERERLEAAYDLYCEFTNSNVVDATCMSSYDFERSLVLPKWLAVIDKTGYRKKEGD